MIRVIVVPVGEELLRYEEIPVPTYDGIRSLLDGGMLEGIGGDNWFGYVDEEGKMKGLPVNGRATRLARHLGWRGMQGDVLCGPVVFLGPADEDGDDTSVQDHVRVVATALGICG